MKHPAYYAKAIWAFLGTAVGACIAVVAATPHHSFGDLDTLAWLTLIATILGVPLGTYAIPNKVVSRVRRTEAGQSALFVLLVVLVILCFGGGFVVRWLFYAAVILIILAVLELLVWHPRSRR